MQTRIEAVMRSCSLARAATGEPASYIEVVGARMDFPAGLAMAHQRLDAVYSNG
jgi:indolepyruvate decarboxylase